ncbi:hypothetical protein K438DRAFT_1977953 [Mycena galopus ATCC 62051]|nr:hypothetical protein K438DRAFT_1977953 [Mycena galopus ATCC 62051]
MSHNLSSQPRPPLLSSRTGTLNQRLAELPECVTQWAILAEDTNELLAVSTDVPPAADACSLKRLRTDDAAVTTARDNEERDPEPTDDEPTIDEPESRPHRPLPHRNFQPHAMNATPYTFPDPESTYRLPTMVGENPHLKETQEDPAPAILPNADNIRVPFTLKIFPRIVLTLAQLTKNMAEGQVADIVANPSNFIALIPHGAGKKFFDEHPHANREAKEFIESLRTDEMSVEGIDVALPKAKHKAKRDSDGPYPMILTGANAALAEFLTWHQTFSVNARLTFHALKFDHTVVSWVVMTIAGDAVRDGPETKVKVLGAIKKRCWGDGRFGTITAGLQSEAGVAGSFSHRIVSATDTFDLTYIHSDNAQGDAAPIFLLTAKPLTSDPEKHKRWLQAIRDIPGGYFVGMHALQINTRLLDCFWCKNQTHPAHGCAFHKVDGWLGVIPDNAQRHEDRIRRNKERDEGRGDRDHRSYDRERGSSRRKDRDARGGWQVVKHGRSHGDRR